MLYIAVYIEYAVCLWYKALLRHFYTSMFIVKINLFSFTADVRKVASSSQSVRPEATAGNVELTAKDKSSVTYETGNILFWHLSLIVSFVVKRET